jgi:ABC-type branched-subunit amino acid transport system ATPase component
MTANGSAPALCATNVSVGYGEVAVVHDVNLEVRPGQLVALIGPNGAGKTTVLRALAGELRPSAGEITVNGSPAVGRLHRRAAAGLGYLTDERSVFMGLTARENLTVGRVTVADCLNIFPELESRLDVKAGDLSGGEQQMLSLGRLLCRRPSVVLADELSLGLAPLIVERLLKTLRAAADEDGVAVIVVEQHVQEVLRYGDWVYALEHGRIHLSGTPEDIEPAREALVSSYLGRTGTRND